MPEVEKQVASSSIQEGESNVKPGGLSFDVVLEEAKTDEKPTLKCPPTPTLSAEDIEKKLKVIIFHGQLETFLHNNRRSSCGGSRWRRLP